jgi:hypothetical protein
MSAPHKAIEQKRLGTSTQKDLHILCYQHHTEMLVTPPSQLGKGPLYACREPSCLIRYDTSAGYIIATDDAKTIEEERMPRVSCPKDAQLMYLAEVTPEKRNFRLWKCPQCDGSRTNQEDSDGLGKKMGA